MEEQVGRRDDGTVDELHGTPEAHTEILIEHGYDDVGASCRTVVREDDTQSGTSHERTYDDVHELVLSGSNEQRLLEEGLQQSHKHRHYAHTDNGAHNKLLGKSLEGYDKHRDVKHKNADTGRNVGGVIKEG